MFDGSAAISIRVSKSLHLSEAQWFHLPSLVRLFQLTRGIPGLP